MYNESSNHSPATDAPQPERSVAPSPQIRTQALRFSHLTDSILERLKHSATSISRHYLRALEQNPERYDGISAYYVRLLAQQIRREADLLYGCLQIDTITLIERSYHEWFGQESKPK